MTITIIQNETFGQLYVERSDDPSNNIRIPSTRVPQFLEDIEGSGFSPHQCPVEITEDCEIIWAIAEQYEG